jgi:hypothetical protein
MLNVVNGLRRAPERIERRMQSARAALSAAASFLHQARGIRIAHRRERFLFIRRFPALLGATLRRKWLDELNFAMQSRSHYIADISRDSYAH